MMRLSGFAHSALGAIAAVAMLAGCGAGAPSTTLQAASTNRVRMDSNSDCSSQCCPALPGGTGILVDGDFSEATDPGNQFIEPHKGQVFAPEWDVVKRNV